MYLNLELRTETNIMHVDNRRNFGRITFHTEDVDGLYSRFKNYVSIAELVSFENEPTDALWGERFFHIRDPDGYKLSFATPTSRKSNEFFMGQKQC
jgi:uncharacterized glyoxalase superfamily protein PhnB